jgi:IS1 family transposase
VVWERTTEALQDVVEGADPAAQYYSDALATYETLVYYPGRHAVAPGKSQTYSVEADNAELRHYLARLGRKSRCFSRSIDALRRAVKLFVHAWNRRQLHKRAFPRYACHVSDFVCP